MSGEKAGTALERLMEEILYKYGCYTQRNHLVNCLGVKDEIDVDSFHPTFHLRVVVECKQLESSKFKKDYINTFSDKISTLEADFGILAATVVQTQEILDYLVDDSKKLPEKISSLIDLSNVKVQDLSHFDDYCLSKKILLWDYKDIYGAFRNVEDHERLPVDHKDFYAAYFKSIYSFANSLMPFAFTSFIDNLKFDSKGLEFIFNTITTDEGSVIKELGEKGGAEIALSEHNVSAFAGLAKLEDFIKCTLPHQIKNRAADAYGKTNKIYSIKKSADNCIREEQINQPKKLEKLASQLINELKSLRKQCFKEAPK